MEVMKTTLEIPDSVFRSAKARAAEKGIPLLQFVTEAVEEKLKTSASEAKPWMQVVGYIIVVRLSDETTREVFDYGASIMDILTQPRPMIEARLKFGNLVQQFAW